MSRMVKPEQPRGVSPALTVIAVYVVLIVVCKVLGLA